MDALTKVLAGFQRAGADLTVEELCAALWLCDQGLPSPGAGPATGATPIREHADPPDQRAVAATADPVPAEPDRAPGIYPPGQLFDGTGDLRPARTVRLPASLALPHARDLARALRPLRYDSMRTFPTDEVDEEATAHAIALARIRVPVLRTTRRRRLDVDVVLDLGGSGPLWDQLALEFRTMLEDHGAFRSVRLWTIDSDVPDLPLRIGRLGQGVLDGGGTRYPWGAVCPAPRKPVVVVLTDGTGREWQSRQVHRPLRAWAAYGRVVLVQLLPSHEWNRTALRAVPVTFRPTEDGYHSGARIQVDPDDLPAAGLGEDDNVRTATAIPVIGLDAEWFRSWVPLLRGCQAGEVPGYALLIGERQRAGHTVPSRAGVADGTGEPAAAGPHAGPELRGEYAEGPRRAAVLDGERRVRRFLATASGDAGALARLLSVGPLDLNVMRKLRSELLPRSHASAMAEILLSGLLSWTAPLDTKNKPGVAAFAWHPGVQEALQARPGGPDQLRQDRAQVADAIWRDRPTGRSFPVYHVGSGGDTKITVPAGAQPLPEPPGAGSRWDPANPAQTGPQSRPEAEPAEPEVAAELWLEPGVDSAEKALRIGIWGSTQSGRTTFLIVLASLGWQPGRPGEEWRVKAADERTQTFVDAKFRQLSQHRSFPGATLPETAKTLSFQLIRRRREGARPWRWLRARREAKISVRLQDRPGAAFGTDTVEQDAMRYLADSDVLLWFFDPTYDSPDEHSKWHSLDFFTSAEAHLGLEAAIGGTLRDRFLPQHMAICMPKLDDQDVFNLARVWGCVEEDPVSGLPWVPSRLAGTLFERNCREQHRSEADYLLRQIRNSFHPDRTSFHALSSVGYLISEAGQLDLHDVCNVRQRRGGQPELRGAIRPFHVLDPLISLVERAEPDL